MMAGLAGHVWSFDELFAAGAEMRTPWLVVGALIGFCCYWLTTPFFPRFASAFKGWLAPVFWMAIGLGIGLYLDAKKNRP
jgi:hypothetical protein